MSISRQREQGHSRVNLSASVDYEPMGKYMGVPCRVAVLDGGFPAWQANDYPVDSETLSDAEVDAAAYAARQSPPRPSRYPAKLQVNGVMLAE